MSSYSSQQRFLEAGKFLRNWSPTTIRTYTQCLASLDGTPLTKAGLDQWVIRLRQRGLSPGGINVRIRSVNSFLAWLHEEGELDQLLKVKLLKAPLRQTELLTAAEMRALVTYRPAKRELRTFTLCLLLLDTGIRISEALALERKKVDLDQLILTVVGKGAKERVVPFSPVLRKALFRHIQAREVGKFLFSTRYGGALSYHNACRDLQRFCVKAGVTRRIHPHLFRSQFASSYVQHGGDIYRLSRLLGHASVTTTQLYLRGLGASVLLRDAQTLSPLTL